nr:MAG TPA: hypothetical protein [Caudoviricetes sp.]
MRTAKNKNKSEPVAGSLLFTVTAFYFKLKPTASSTVM